MKPRVAQGQATVEVALVLPLLALVLAVLLQAGLVVLDNVRLWHAAREGARAAVVDPAPHAARLAVGRAGFRDAEVTVEPEPSLRRRGAPLTVRLRYRPAVRVPVIKALFGHVTLKARATMRIERP